MCRTGAYVVYICTIKPAIMSRQSISFTKPNDEWLNQQVSNEEYDFFVFYNLFKVLSIGINPTAPINFCVANSMIDEIKADEEGRIIEKALIKYFGTETQELNKRNEESELENSLERLAAKNNINSVAIHIEMEEPSELHRFFSRSVKPSDKHVFTCRIGNSGVEIVEGSNLAASVLQV